MTLTDFVVQVKMRQTWENLHNSSKKYDQTLEKDLCKKH